MHSNEAAAVGEYRLDLNHWNEIGDAIHDIILGQNLAGLSGDILNGLAGACAIQCGSGNDCDSLGMVELEAFGLPFQCDLRDHIDNELVELSWRQLHFPPPPLNPAGSFHLIFDLSGRPVSGSAANITRPKDEFWC